jgi:predicted porin
MSTSKLDLFEDTAADYNALIGFQDNRAPDVVAYVSPSMGGFTMAGALVAGNNFGADGVDAYSVAGMYSNGPIYGALGYESFDEDATNEDDNKIRVGLGFDMDAFTINAIYEDHDKGVGGGEASLWQLQAAYKFGNNKIKGSYGQFDPDGAADSSDSWALGFDHDLSKQTSVYALYGDSERALNVESSGFVNTGGSVSTDDSASVFSIGTIHKF